MSKVESTIPRRWHYQDINLICVKYSHCICSTNTTIIRPLTWEIGQYYFILKSIRRTTMAIELQTHTINTVICRHSMVNIYTPWIPKLLSGHCSATLKCYPRSGHFSPWIPKPLIGQGSAPIIKMPIKKSGSPPPRGKAVRLRRGGVSR